MGSAHGNLEKLHMTKTKEYKPNKTYSRSTELVVTYSGETYQRRAPNFKTRNIPPTDTDWWLKL